MTSSTPPQLSTLLEARDSGRLQAPAAGRASRSPSSDEETVSLTSVPERVRNASSTPDNYPTDSTGVDSRAASESSRRDGPRAITPTMPVTRTGGEGVGVDNKGSADGIVEILRLTEPSGRVLYKILYTDGRVVEATPRTILDHVDMFTLQNYEHKNYAQEVNMETKYVPKASMGGWIGGTSQNVIRKADKRLQADSGALEDKRLPDWTDSESSETSDFDRKSKHSAKRPSKRTSRFYAGITTDESSRSTSVVPEPLSSGKLRQVLAEVSVGRRNPAGSKQSSIRDFFGASRHAVAASSSENQSELEDQQLRSRQRSSVPTGNRTSSSRSVSSTAGRKRAFSAVTSGSQTDEEMEYGSPLMIPDPDDPDDSDYQASQSQPHTKGSKPKPKLKAKPKEKRKLDNDTDMSLNIDGDPGIDPSFSSPSRSPSPLPSPSSSNYFKDQASAMRDSSKKSRLKAKIREQGSRESSPEYEVEMILDHRDRDGAREYKVKWVGFGHEGDSWEPAENLGGSKELVKDYLRTLDDLQ